MPCNSLAVQRLKLAPKIAEEILATDGALKPLIAVIEATVRKHGLANATVTQRINDKKSYADILITDGAGRTQAQLLIYSEAWLVHSGRRLDTPTLQVQGQNRSLVPVLAKAVTEFGEPYGLVLARERTRRVVRETLRVTAEARTATGAIVQRVRLRG